MGLPGLGSYPAHASLRLRALALIDVVQVGAQRHPEETSALQGVVVYFFSFPLCFSRNLSLANTGFSSQITRTFPLLPSSKCWRGSLWFGGRGAPFLSWQTESRLSPLFHPKQPTSARILVCEEDTCAAAKETDAKTGPRLSPGASHPKVRQTRSVSTTGREFRPGSSLHLGFGSPASDPGVFV